MCSLTLSLAEWNDKTLGFAEENNFDATAQRNTYATIENGARGSQMTDINCYNSDSSRIVRVPPGRAQREPQDYAQCRLNKPASHAWKGTYLARRSNRSDRAVSGW